MRIKFNDRHITDFGGSMIDICLELKERISLKTGWYICIYEKINGSYAGKYLFYVGKDGDTGFNGERVEKIAENEINFAFLNGFLDLSDYEEVT